MNDFGQLQPLRNAACDRGGQCCGSTNMSDTTFCDTAISLRQCSCSRPKLAIFKHRQTSVTSGDSAVSGLSLDPITEYQDSAELDVEESNHCSQAVIISETCNSRRHECACVTGESPTDESGLLSKSVCERHSPIKTEKKLSGSRISEPYAIGRSHIIRNGRIRTQSEGCPGNNIIFPGRNHSKFAANSCANCHHQQHLSMALSGTDNIQQKEFCVPKELRSLRRRYRQLLCFTAFIFIILSLCIGLGIVAYSINRSKFKDFDSKIEELEGGGAKSKPHIHLQLNGFPQLLDTPWKGKVLSWIPDVSQSNVLRYNGDTFTITVTEAGSYFVYSQIYIARQERIKADFSNQTVMHSINKIPFNYPSSRKPLTVSESVLTHCWDEDATTQVHASYMGIIVSMGENEQLLVALESFHDSVDNLMPANTFFGVFKL